MGCYSINEKERAKAIKMVEAGKTARDIAEVIGVAPHVIRALAKKSNLKCRTERIYIPKEPEYGGRWVNLVARNSGLPDNMI